MKLYINVKVIYFNILIFYKIWLSCFFDKVLLVVYEINFCCMYMLKIICRKFKYLKFWKNVWFEDGNDIIVNVILKVIDNV